MTETNINDLMLENFILKQRILELEKKIYGCSEEEHLMKTRLKEIKNQLLCSLFDMQPCEKDDLINSVKGFTKEEILDVLDYLIRKKLIVIEGQQLYRGCITPTGLTDRHMIYVLAGHDKLRCAFCGRE